MNMTLFPSQLSHKNKDFSGGSFWACSSERFARGARLQLAPEQQTEQEEALGPKNYNPKQNFDKTQLLWAEVHSVAETPSLPWLNALTQGGFVGTSCL